MKCFRACLPWSPLLRIGSKLRLRPLRKPRREMRRGKYLRAAAFDLAALAENLAERLRLGGTRFDIAKTGGMMGRSKYLESQLDERLRNAFPQAEIGVLRDSPAEAAARMALRLLSSGNVAVENPMSGNSASGKVPSGDATGH